MARFRLGEIRDKRDVSSRELGEHLGVQHSTVLRWEKGETSPDQETVQSIAEFFDIEIDELYQTRGWVRSTDMRDQWRNEVIGADVDDTGFIVMQTLPVFLDEPGPNEAPENATWVVSTTPEAVASECNRDVERVRASWENVFACDYIERVGVGEWVFKLILPDNG